MRRKKNSPALNEFLAPYKRAVRAWKKKPDEDQRNICERFRDTIKGFFKKVDV